MKLTTLRNALALCAAIAATTACSTTSPPASAGSKDVARGARAIFGTSLIGTRGATERDQDNIDDAVAGGCAAGSYTKSECVRHEKVSATKDG
jgi:hypothetical protein